MKRCSTILLLLILGAMVAPGQSKKASDRGRTKGWTKVATSRLSILVPEGWRVVDSKSEKFITDFNQLVRLGKIDKTAAADIKSAATSGKFELIAMGSPTKEGYVPTLRVVFAAGTGDIDNLGSTVARSLAPLSPKIVKSEVGKGSKSYRTIYQTSKLASIWVEGNMISLNGNKSHASFTYFYPAVSAERTRPVIEQSFASIKLK